MGRSIGSPKVFVTKEQVRTLTWKSAGGYMESRHFSPASAGREICGYRSGMVMVMVCIAQLTCARRSVADHEEQGKDEWRVMHPDASSGKRSAVIRRNSLLLVSVREVWFLACLAAPESPGRTQEDPVRKKLLGTAAVRRRGERRRRGGWSRVPSPTVLRARVVLARLRLGRLLLYALR